jgi:hypothetical protein
MPPLHFETVADPTGTVIFYAWLYTLQCKGEVPVDALYGGVEE